MNEMRTHGPLSENDFLAWAEPCDERCELVEGMVVMQAGASRDHERVAKAVFASMYAQVDALTFDVNKGDFGVRIDDGSGRGSVLYPDVVVDLQSADGDARVTTTAQIIAEVLSPSTDLAHHIRKLERYKRVESLLTYLVLDQKAPIVHIWRKRDGVWPARPVVVDAVASAIVLSEIGVTLSLSTIYRTPREA